MSNYDTLGEAVALTAIGGKPAPAVAVVRGGVASVESGVSASWDLTEDGADRKILAFGDPKAQINTYHLTIRVKETFAKAPKFEIGETVKVGLALDPKLDPDQVSQDLQRIDDAVFFLQRSPVFDYQDDLLGVTMDGALIGFVKDGKIEYPMVEGPDIFTTGGRDLSSLRSAGKLS